MSASASDSASNITNKTNRNKPKACAYCGKSETCNWVRHFTDEKYVEFHSGNTQKKEWVKDTPLEGTEWCANWKDVANGKGEVKPEGVNPAFATKGFKKGNDLH
jgi:hypothetical protein